jgi:TetR/AcrR family transcriptional repressor of nem operon
MPKPSHRNKRLTEGLKVLLARGYFGASVRDIVKAAGVPQGSFTNHFSSKEAGSVFRRRANSALNGTNAR